MIQEFSVKFKKSNKKGKVGEVRAMTIKLQLSLNDSRQGGKGPLDIVPIKPLLTPSGRSLSYAVLLVVLARGCPH